VTERHKRKDGLKDTKGQLSLILRPVYRTGNGYLPKFYPHLLAALLPT